MNKHEHRAHNKASHAAKKHGRDFMVLYDPCYEDCEPESYLAMSADAYEQSTLEVEGCQVVAVYGPDGRLPDFD